MSKKTAAPESSANTQSTDDSFVVLFDEKSRQSGEDGGFVVMLEDAENDAATEAAPVVDDDGSFVVMLDGEDESPPPGQQQDKGFVVLLDEEDTDHHCVTQLEDGVFMVALPSDIRMQKIVAIKPELVATLGARKVQYDATRVEYADTASIQVVAAHLAALDACEASVEWVGSSSDFLETARLLGFDFTAPPAQDENENEVEELAQAA